MSLLVVSALLLSSPVQADPGDAQIVLDSSLADPSEGAAWTVYAGTLSLAATGDDEAHPPWAPFHPTFDDEVNARQALVEVWGELNGKKKKRKKKKGDSPGPTSDTNYFDTLTAVEDAGLMREYVWVYLRALAWPRPDGLQLDAFQQYKAENLQGHQAQTRAAVEIERAPVPDDIDAAVLAEQAREAMVRGEPEQTIALASRALDVDPDQPLALWLRAVLRTADMSAIADEDARTRLATQVTADLERILEESPQSSQAALVLQSFSKQPKLSLPSTPCPDAARAAFAAAEVHFQARELRDALDDYDTGLELCPDSAQNWVYSGDALYGLKDVDGALQRYQHALTLDSCHWQAHRFIGDVLMKIDRKRARDAYTHALACNPSYVQAWRAWKSATRVSSPRPVWLDGKVEWTGEPDAALKPAYDAWAEATRAGDDEVTALRRALEAHAELGQDSPFFAHMAEADDAGLLQAAMHVQLFGPDRIPAFLTYRDAHLTELVRYLDTLVLP